MGRRQVPTLGVNLGRLGFLAEVAYAKGEGVAVLKHAIESAFAGRLPERSRLMVECRNDSDHEPVLVLNDAVVQRSREHGLIGVSAKVGGEYVTTYFGDGLIMSTAVGSTAYSLAAGGPILSPDLDALVLTPLAPHALPVRPLVVQASKGIEMQIEGKPGTEIGSVSLDGQVHWPVVASDVLYFEVSPVRFRLLSLEGSNFFKILRRKFGWAGSPRYER